jgi:CBS domain-containing protein
MGAGLRSKDKSILSSTIASVLYTKGTQVYSVSPEQFAIDAVTLMTKKGIGAVLVVSAGRPVGVVSAKDHSKRVVLEGKSSENTRIHAIMTSPVITITPETTVAQAMALMTKKRIRHLPVMDGDRLAGIVAIGDLGRAIIAEQAHAIDELHGYIGHKYPG